MDSKTPFSYKGPIFSAAILPDHAQPDRLRQNIADLDRVRGSLVTRDDLSAVDTLIVYGTGTGKAAALVAQLWSETQAPQRGPMRAKSTATIDIGAIETASLPRPPTAVLSPYRPVHHWLRLAELDRSDFPLPPPEQATPVLSPRRMAQSASPGLHGSRVAALCFLLDGFTRLAALAEEPVTLFVRLNRLQQLRDGLLQLIHGKLTALRLALMLVLTAFNRRLVRQPHFGL